MRVYKATVEPDTKHEGGLRALMDFLLGLEMMAIGADTADLVSPERLSRK